jgi:hypothetical protein
MKMKKGALVRKIFIFPIRVYQICISPFYPARCRFYPSCSEYTALAIEKHGVIRGIWLGIKRICRCNPWCQGGFDPVPENIEPCKVILKKIVQTILSLSSFITSVSTILSKITVK